MKIATKTLATLLIATVMSLSLVSGVSAASGENGNRKTNNQRLERIQRRHDRKLVLHASVLGISADELKAELKQRSFDQMLKRHGFHSYDAFTTALVGKLKEELKHRGWSDRKITHFLNKRLDRLTA